MKLLVSGASGFTGRHFIAAARLRGHEIAELQANLSSREEVLREVAEVRPDAVVHLAAIAFVGHADNRSFYDVNVIGTANLLDALIRLPQTPRKILLASSANVYGNCERSPITEDQAPAPINHYAISKLAMEHMARTYLNRLPLFFTRPFNYTGPGQNEAFIIPKLVAHFARKAALVELGNLNVEREFNDVRFVSEAYLQLLDNARPGEVYNVATGNPHTLQTVIDLLARLSGHSMEIRVNPAFIRDNDISRLCGSADKLFATIGLLDIPSLEETLSAMLREPLS